MQLDDVLEFAAGLVREAGRPAVGVTGLHGDEVLTGNGSVPASNGLLHDGPFELLPGIPHGRDVRTVLG